MAKLEKIISITLNFRVADEETLMRLAKEAVEEHGGGYELQKGSCADAAVELLLNSNPDIKAYLDYGLELIDTELRERNHTGEETEFTAKMCDPRKGILS